MLFNKNPFHFYFLSVVYFYYVILFENSRSSLVILISLIRSISLSWECKEMQFESYTFQQPLVTSAENIHIHNFFFFFLTSTWNQCKPSRLSALKMKINLMKNHLPTYSWFSQPVWTQKDNIHYWCIKRDFSIPLKKVI